MSMLMEDEPLVLAATDTRPPCAYETCTAESEWSTIWDCGEVGPYCDAHRIWAERQSATDQVHCDCPGVMTHRIIHIILVVPL